MDELLTAEQVAASWGVSPSLLRQPMWRQRHGLVAIRVGRLLRFAPAQVSDFVQRHAEPGVALRGASLELRNSPMTAG